MSEARMAWQLFRWTWRLEGPLFVGISPTGALNRCRSYVPARAIWGAVTAELARFGADDDPNYRDVRKTLRECARFSYLYPAELVGEHWLAWLPEYREEDGLLWVREGGDTALADRRFRRRLLWTRPATAIDPDNDSALEGSLRETECVQPRWRPDEDSLGSPVSMVGYVFLKSGEDLPKGLSALSTLFVGGDARYGLGRLNQVAMVRAEEFFGATVAVDDMEPRVFAKRALGHALAANGALMYGDQEAIGGWDMASEHQGRRISGPVWTPGSRIVGEDGKPPFRIDEDGLWHLDAESAPRVPSKGAT